MLADETVQAVRDRVKVADVVGERVKLERRGRSLVGLCPFHKEKTPSFHVNDERGFYYCFGCHASGDAIKFVQETEGFSFTEAIRELALRHGIDIVESRTVADRAKDDAARKRRDELLQANEAAAEFFERSLWQHALSHHARAELTRRALDATPPSDTPRTPVDEALRAFRVGYAPYAWDALATHLRLAGVSLKAAETLGLVGARKQGGGFYDRFRHRLMFAVIDLRGKVVAFSGRALAEPDTGELARLGVAPLGTGDGAVAKYLNSPESSVYKKRELVFGLQQAKDQIRERNECLLVEGNFDVVSLHARGVGHAVAPLGTAFTREQAGQIRRYSRNLVLLFDGDSAGLRASMAARDPCKEEDLSVRVARLPKGSDPDDLVRARGADAILACVRSAQGMLEFLIETTLETDFQRTDSEARGRKIQQVLDLIQAEADPTVRALAQAHADTIAARLGIQDVGSLRALSRALRSVADASAPRGGTPSGQSAAHTRGRGGAIEDAILGTLAEHPGLLVEPDVATLLTHASGPFALAIVTLRQWQHALMDNLAAFAPDARQVIARRLAAPELPDREAAREVLFHNLERLAKLDDGSAKEETLRRLREAAASGDVEAEMELLRQRHEAAVERERRKQRLKESR